MEAYRKELLHTYEWAQGVLHLFKFMESVRVTLEGRNTTWSHKGECVTAAWHAIGGKGIPTLKALRELPNK
jgi:hypothetical protein